MACNCKNKGTAAQQKPVKTVVKKDRVADNGKVVSKTKQMMRRNFK